MRSKCELLHVEEKRRKEKQEKARKNDHVSLGSREFLDLFAAAHVFEFYNVIQVFIVHSRKTLNIHRVTANDCSTKRVEEGEGRSTRS